MSPEKHSRPAKENTRYQLLITGERLFAEQGIDAVSLRQVNVAAGQKNSSASHYHFGSKEGLVRAIYEFRMERVNKRRLERLERIAGDESGDNVRALIGAIVYPIIEEMESADSTYYVRFMAQATSHPSNPVNDLGDSENASGLRQIINRLLQIMQDYPPEIVAQRFGLALDQTIHALADQASLQPRSGRIDRNAAALFASNLVDMIAGGISAPISAETEQELNRASRQKA